MKLFYIFNSNLRLSKKQTFVSNPYFVPHVFDGDTRHGFEIFVSAVDEDTVDSLVLPVYVQLGEDDDVLSVTGTVGNLKSG
jgi:hypothetical protein